MNSESKEIDYSIIKKLLSEYPLCDKCLGRQFPHIMEELDNEQRGIALRKLVKIPLRGKCFICHSLMSSLQELMEEVLKTISEYEFDNFMIGTTLPPDVIEREDTIRARFKLKGGETLKSELNREVGSFIISKTGKQIKTRGADLTILIAPFSKPLVTIQSRPIYLFGHYLKKERGIRQKRVRCKKCRGSGCVECDHSGISRQESVEEYLSKILLNHFKGSGVRYTWVGGEDSNSLVLGNGRPFFGEILNSKVRSLVGMNLPINIDNKIILKDLQIVDKPKVIPRFTVDLFLHIKFKEPIDYNRLKGLEETLKDAVIHQISLRKRKILDKKVYNFKIISIDEDEIKVEMSCDGGLNIKK
ncbi:MAG: tRNA pseudouridine(54/55) synthase Pus10, partial [Nitrososphaerales archaeon]|nr:tRNA pseudouridine(54/55) synthase Pus10 [Nitrososphaerales archaeon]